MKINRENTLGRDEIWCLMYTCPNCKDEWITGYSNYCHNCGEEIEWIETLNKIENGKQ